MERYQANKKILDILKNHLVVEKYNWIPSWFEKEVDSFRDHRCGQIFCNHLNDYRSGNPSLETKDILGTLFPGNPDPFFEESTVTLNRLNLSSVEHKNH